MIPNPLFARWISFCAFRRTHSTTNITASWLSYSDLKLHLFSASSLAHPFSTVQQSDLSEVQIWSHHSSIPYDYSVKSSWCFQQSSCLCPLPMSWPLLLLSPPFPLHSTTFNFSSSNMCYSLLCWTSPQNQLFPLLGLLFPLSPHPGYVPVRSGPWHFFHLESASSLVQCLSYVLSKDLYFWHGAYTSYFNAYYPLSSTRFSALWG